MRPRNIVWTIALIVGALFSYRLGLHAAADESGGSGLHFTGDVALWTVAINADKTADYEKVLTRLNEALHKSNDPVRNQQAAGWRVVKVDQPLPDGTIAYVHVITPVVQGADYTLLKPIYEAFPSEAKDIYEMYRGAFAKNLALASGKVVMDMSKPAVSPAPQPQP